MSKTRKIKELKAERKKLQLERSEVMLKRDKEIKKLKEEGIREYEFLTFFVSPITARFEEIVKRLKEIKKELFLLQHGTTNSFTSENGTVLGVWYDDGDYTEEFLRERHKPYLRGWHGWDCTKCGDFDCESRKKIRLSEDLDVVKINDEPVRKHMKKPHIEKMFGVKIIRSDLKDLDFIAGFYSYDTGFGFKTSAIFDVLEFIDRYEENIIKKKGQDFIKIFEHLRDKP